MIGKRQLHSPSVARPPDVTGPGATRVRAGALSEIVVRIVQKHMLRLFAHCAALPSTVVDVPVASPPASHRERKKLATRRAIHDAAFALVDRHGLSGTTVEAISERAGVAPRTFWSYFGSKEDAVIDRDPQLPGLLMAELLARPAEEDAMSALRVVLERRVAERLVDSERSVRWQLLIHREPQLMAAVAASYHEIEGALVSAVADRLGVDAMVDTGPAVLVMAACGTCRVAQIRWADERGGRSFGELMAEAFSRLADGLAPLHAGLSRR